MDIAFIVDASGSIGKKNFQKQRNFLKLVASTYNVSPQGSQCGIVVYSANATVHSRFDEADSMEKLSNIIDDIPFYGHTTRHRHRPEINV